MDNFSDSFGTNFENAQNAMDFGMKFMLIFMIVFFVIVAAVVIFVFISVIRRRSKMSAATKEIFSKSMDVINTKLDEAKGVKECCEYCGTVLEKDSTECGACGAKRKPKK